MCFCSVCLHTQLFVSCVLQLLSFVHVFLLCPEEILERLRAKKEEELEEVKRRAAEEAQKARLEQEKKEVDVEKEDEDANLKDEGQQEGKVKALTKEEETKEEETEEIKDGVKTEGDYDFYLSQSILKNTTRCVAQNDGNSSIKIVAKSGLKSCFSGVRGLLSILFFILGKKDITMV